MDLVQDKIEKSDTSFRKAVSSGKQIAVALWRLATGNSYHTTISKDFGIGLSIVTKSIYEFYEAILEISHEFIHSPNNSRETAIAIQKFRAFSESKIPQVFGVNNGTHMEILYEDLESRIDYTFEENKGIQSIPWQLSE